LIWGFFSHASIIIGLMLVVFFLIDRFNPAAGFLTSGLSQWLILLFAICATGNGLLSAQMLFQRKRRQEEKRQAAHHTQPYGDSRGAASYRERGETDGHF
jgi:hypothetical protein